MWQLFGLVCGLLVTTLGNLMWVSVKRWVKYGAVDKKQKLADFSSAFHANI